MARHYIYESCPKCGEQLHSKETLAAVKAERDTLLAVAEKWRNAVLERYPVGMEFDCTNPGLMIENICRAEVERRNKTIARLGNENGSLIDALDAVRKASAHDSDSETFNIAHNALMSLLPQKTTQGGDGGEHGE